MAELSHKKVENKMLHIQSEIVEQQCSHAEAGGDGGDRHLGGHMIHVIRSSRQAREDGCVADR